MLQINNVYKKYRNQTENTLEDISFSVKKGEFTALLGPNGAGKTTLINILAGITDRNSGQITIAGHDIDSGHIELKTLVGIVPQEIVFDNLFTVRESLKLQSGYFGLRRNGEYEDYLMHRLSLYEKRNETIISLSGGMKRRLMIAKAMVHSPELLVLDEPTAGVDIKLRHDLYEFVKELNAKGTTVLLTTHYLEEAEALCGRIILINRGKLAADKPKTEFLKLAGDYLTLKISSPDDLSKFTKHFEDSACTDGMLTLRFHRNALSGVMAKLAASGITLTDISLSPPGIEEIFVKLTSGDRQ